MPFKIVSTVLSAAVATSGTFTVSYPAGTQAGSFAGAWAHEMFAHGHQKSYVAPSQFSLSFGASSITVTYLGTTTLPANSKVDVKLDMLGTDDGEADKVLTLSNVVDANVVYMDLGSPTTADTDGIAASQSVTGAGTAFVLNGVLVSNGVGTFDTPRNVVAAWTGTAILTITGKDIDGITVVEKSASGTSHTGSKAFKSITGITTSASITAATVGAGVKLGLPRFVPNASHILQELKNGVALPRYPSVVTLTGVILEANVDTPLAFNFVSPVAGNIRKLTTIASATVTTGGDFTVEVNTVAVNGLTVVVANGAAAGEIDSDVATLDHATTVVAVGDRITVTPGSAFSGAADFTLILEIDTTAAGQMSGTFVAGVTSAATATTGDTRGTYSPLTAPDGTAGYRLLVALPDPGNKGVAQYTG